jgi:hypothetical protein
MQKAELLALDSRILQAKVHSDSRMNFGRKSREIGVNSHMPVCFAMPRGRSLRHSSHQHSSRRHSMGDKILKGTEGYLGAKGRDTQLPINTHQILVESH